MHTGFQKCGRFIWISAWTIGFYYTLKVVYRNWLRYGEYRSIINQRDYDYYESKVK